MSKFRISDKNTTTRELPISTVPVYNAQKLYNSKLDVDLDNVTSGNVLYYDGTKWTYLPISLTPNVPVFSSFISSSTQTPNTLNPTTNPKAVTYSSKEVGNILLENNTYPGSKIVIPVTGIYRVLFSAQCDSTSGNGHYLEFWPVVDGTAVPNSNTKIVLNTGAESCLTVEYFLSLNANAKLELYMAGTEHARILAYDASGLKPLTPSMIMNINKL